VREIENWRRGHGFAAFYADLKVRYFATILARAIEVLTTPTLKEKI